MSPNLSWAKGAERRMPSGKLLSGTHPDSLWSHTSRLGHSSPAAAIEQWLVNIERAAEQFEGIKKEGGTLSLYFDLDGRQNIGDVFSPGLLGRLAALGIELGIEVFPNREFE